MPAAHLNRGLVALGIAATIVALADAYLAGAFYVVFTCFDACANIGTALANGQLSVLRALVIPLAALAPAVGLTVSCWIWELVELRRRRAFRVVRVTWFFPLITLVCMLSVMVLTSVTSAGSLALYGSNVWYGSLAIVLWPALVTLVAVAWRDPVASVPTSSPGAESSQSADTA